MIFHDLLALGKANAGALVLFAGIQTLENVEELVFVPGVETDSII